MKRSVKRILPVLLALLVIGSILWYFGVYDRGFTQELLLSQARFFDDRGNHNVASWFYDLAYRQSGNDEAVAIELAEKFKEVGNYTKAEYTLSNAIADGGSVELYKALCRTYVQQNKLLDAVTMLDNVADPEIREQLDALRPQIPVPTPAPGFYSQYISVSLESPHGTLYVSTDQDYPSTGDAPHSDSVTLVSGENTIYALAVGEDGLVSKLAVYGYVVGGVVEEISLADSAMDAMVRKLLNKGPEDILLSSELWSITAAELPKDVQTLTDLKYLPYLESLTVENGNFHGLNGLSFLTSLHTLTVRGSVVSASDLATIGSLPKLEKLVLENCGLSSISGLASAQKLTELDLSGNTIRDIQALGSMTALVRLDLSQNALTDISQLSALASLQELNISYNSLTSLVPLSGCTALTALDASHNAIGVLNGLESLTALTTLSLSYNNLTDISLLSGASALASLDISNNTLLDISALSGLKNLAELDFSRNEVSTLPAFATDSPLVTVNGSYNKITKLDSLSGLGALNNVIMEYNKIKSVDVLASCHHLITVNVFGNPVKDVTKLTEQSVIVYYTPV